MIIESLISSKRNFFWVIFHVIFGFVCTFTPYALIFWFYGVLFSSISKAVLNLKKGNPFLYIALFTYLTAFELLGRMSKTSPIIPVELSKYIIIFFSILGIIITQKTNKFWFGLGIISALLLFIDNSGQRNFFDIIFNYFGFMAVCLFLSFFLVQKFNKISIHLILKLLLLSIIPALFFSFIKTPDIEDIQFKLSANFDTAGGAATNQVATVFGLGFMLCFYFWYKKIEFSGYRSFDLLLGISFFAQGLLTFSRGGIIVGILAILFFFILDSGKLNIKNISLSIVLYILVIFTFNYIDNISDGKLYLRYQGETEGTYNYGVDKDLKKITSGRSVIFEEDLKLWVKNPILGVGVGSSRYLRGGLDGKTIAAHIELSRLLAEQGLIGLIYFLSLINIGIKLWKISRMDKTKVIYLILFVVGFLSTFHAAMRTFVTPLLIGLSVIGIQHEINKNENSIYRSN